MKKNKNGFLLAEAFIVSTFVLGVLIFIYVESKNISVSYNRSYSYNTVRGLYITNEIDEYFNSVLYEDKKDELNLNGYVDIIEFPVNIKDLASIKRVIVSLPTINLDIDELELDNKFADYINWVKKHNTMQNYSYIIMVEFEDDTFASLRK